MQNHLIVFFIVLAKWSNPSRRCGQNSWPPCNGHISSIVKTIDYLSNTLLKVTYPKFQHSFCMSSPNPSPSSSYIRPILIAKKKTRPISLPPSGSAALDGGAPRTAPRLLLRAPPRSAIATSPAAIPCCVLHLAVRLRLLSLASSARRISPPGLSSGVGRPPYPARCPRVGHAPRCPFAAAGGSRNEQKRDGRRDS
jgi:hypothetical protein